MKFMGEHEMAFDGQALGFPSIQGCHAIVYQTSQGIYGYHNYGGSATAAFSVRAARFRHFLQQLGALNTPAYRLYGVSFVGNNQRGYAMNDVKGQWKQELTEFANALNYTGKISGYDLYKTFQGANDCAYVEFRANHHKCDLYVRQWMPGQENDVMLGVPPQNHHVRHNGVNMQNVDRAFTQISRIGVTKVSKQQLR